MQQQRLAAAADPHMLHAQCVRELEWGLWWGVTSAAHGELYLDAHKPPQAQWLAVGASRAACLHCRHYVFNAKIENKIDEARWRSCSSR